MGGERIISIRTKLLIAFMVLSLIPMVILGISGTMEVKKTGAGVSKQVADELMAKAKNELANVALNTSDKVQLYTQQYKNDITSLDKYPHKESLLRIRMTDPNWQNSPEKLATDKYFISIQKSRPEMNNARVFYKDGSAIVRIRKGEVNLIDETTGKIENRGDKVWFKRTMNPEKVADGDVYVSAINIARTNNEPEIRYTMPVVVDNQRVGLININFKAKAITETIAQTRFGKSGFAFMIDKSYETAEGKPIDGGLYVYHPKNKICDEENPGTVIDMSKLKSDKGFVTFNDAGKEWTAAYHKVPVEGRDWYVVSTLPTAEIMQSVTTVKRGIDDSTVSLNRNFWLLVLASMAIVLIAAFIFSRNITEPVKHLTEIAEKVSMGDTDVEIKVESRDEIGVLAKAFERMVVRVKILMAPDDMDKTA